MLWLYLHFPQLQLDGLLSTLTGTADAAPAIIIVEPKSHAICQLNPSAKAKGLTRGMGLATASALCQPLTVVPYRAEFEPLRLLELANWFYHLTADISLFEPRGMVFAVSSMLALHQGLANYLRKIHVLLQTQAVTASQALGYSPLAAKLLAQAGNATLTEEPQGLQTQLQELAIEYLEVPATTRSQLKRIGIDRLADLKQLPKAELGTRLGVELLDYLAQLEGARPTPLRLFKPAEYFCETLILNHEISHVQALLFPLKLLLGKLQHFLQARAQLVQTLFLTLGYRNQSEQRIEIVSAEPESLCQNWLALLQLKLDKLKLAAPVVNLHLQSTELLECTNQTQDLFDQAPGRLSPKQLSPRQLLSRLQAKVGQQAIQQICLHQDYRPEQAFSYQAFGVKQPAPPLHHSLSALRPSLLFDAPKPLHEAIRLIHGPERIQSAWWSSQPICRDYFVAKNPQQQTLWVFRDAQHRWFVHGLFA